MKSPLQMTGPRLLASAPLGGRVGLRFCRLLAPLRRPAPLAASSPRLPARNATAERQPAARSSRREEALIPSLPWSKIRGSSVLGMVMSMLLLMTGSPSFGQTAVFYRAAATNQTAIASFDRSGLLTCTSSVTNLPIRLERASTPSGPWNSNFAYTVVSAADREMVALVASGSALPPPRPCCDSNLVARVRGSILLEGRVCQIEAYVWYNLMPTWDPPQGLLAAVIIRGAAGVQIPLEAAITLVRVVNGAQVWEVSSPLPQQRPVPDVLETGIANGPLWNRGTRVDVVTQVTVGNLNYLLRATNVVVEVVL